MASGLDVLHFGTTAAVAHGRPVLASFALLYTMYQARLYKAEGACALSTSVAACQEVFCVMLKV